MVVIHYEYTKEHARKRKKRRKAKTAWYATEPIKEKQKDVQDRIGTNKDFESS